MDIDMYIDAYDRAPFRLLERLRLKWYMLSEFPSFQYVAISLCE